ncbi:von Willebrand factor type A domain protein [Stappia aggregata IAM 12614]|uniref:von Willebrand factor type A domain protein n=1 Tax=Roseibium aggregatum (strain ATCC 25650 / DSM 13394 / JCM 20685 / NBRC 16684 / NCIMB 2208 / IAM 12614 / B1) TaxID=384765 RepID=A0P1W4_ROSAI|nr:VWA domain-containing protein [Roseibium aggregatum]EAV41040.1 von Willebrand factor type A domain protein [Stappia aggregata IAM 12614] [Roseibium aggregatum IAM 12614]
MPLSLPRLAVATSLLVASSAFSLVPSSAQAADRATILILDASGSMWAQLPEGRSRIEVARDVLGDYLRSRDGSRPLGVIAYGHNRKGDCQDIETISPVGVQDPASLGSRLNGLSPRGKTPLAGSLRRAATLIPKTSEEADIVLVTDGLETCGLDPCAVAASLAQEGIPVRAHVVGFGLTEGEVRQISCIAETTGGMVLAPQSGAELADALVRVTEPVTREAEAPGKAAINLTIAADISGRPNKVAFRGIHTTSGQNVEFGELDFESDSALPVELAEGAWLLTADAGDKGNGEMEATIVAGDNRTLYVPFTGPMPSVVLPPRGPYLAGSQAAFPYEITNEGLAVGGADFVLSLLPAGTTDLNQALTWSMQDGSKGARVGQLNLPPDAGSYVVAFHRYGESDLASALQSFAFSTQLQPAVTLNAPETAEPGAMLPVTMTGGLGTNDRVEIWKDGALYSWDQSRYVRDLFDNEYGKANPIAAPGEPGAYEIVYLVADRDGDSAIATRMPLTVGAGAGSYEEGAATPGGQVQPVGQQNAATQHQTPASPIPLAGDPDPTHGPDQVLSESDIGYFCEGPFPCPITDPVTGLAFVLPVGWYTDKPAFGGTLGGAQNGTPVITFFSPMEVPDTYVLNPSQWLESNGPCQDVKAGRFCRFLTGTDAPEADVAMITKSLVHIPGLATQSAAATGTASAPDLPAALRGQAGLLAAQDPAAAEAMKGLSTILQKTAENGGEIVPAEIIHALTQGKGLPEIGASLAASGSASIPPMTPCETQMPCPFEVSTPKLSGTLPFGWRISQPGMTPQGKINAWFTAFDPAGNMKKLGLNQDGGEACVPTAAGELCEHTPYISTDEVSLIAGSLTR